MLKIINKYIGNLKNYLASSCNVIIDSVYYLYDGNYFVYMTLEESKKKKEQINNGIQILRRVLGIVDKSLTIYESYDAVQQPNGPKIYGKSKSRYPNPMVIRLNQEDIEDLNFDLEIDKEENNNENT